MKNRENNKTVFIGIPAYNEEQNIGNLLNSILKQQKDNYRLDQIVIICDGCNDHTAEVVREYTNRHEFIRLIEDRKRLGQGERLNQFFRMCQSDIFITFDADTKLTNDKVISEIVKTLGEENVGLVGGNNIPANPKTFVEKTLAIYEIFWEKVKEQINHGDNIHNCPGCIWAGKRELIKKIILPQNIVANDHFIFLKTMDLGYKFKFARKAVSYYRLPNNLKDFFSQTNRFFSSRDNIEQYFGDKCNAYYNIPVSVKLKAYLQTLIQSPFFLTLALGLQFCQRLSNYNYKSIRRDGTWVQISSSK